MDLSIIEDLRQRAIGFNKGTLFTNCTYGRLFVSCPWSEVGCEKRKKPRAWRNLVGGWRSAALEVGGKDQHAADSGQPAA